MPQGKVKWFNNAKGFGFIIADDDEPELRDEDLFAHHSAIQMEGYRTLKAGQEVLFDVQPSNKGFHAINIRPLETSPDAAFNAATAPQPDHVTARELDRSHSDTASLAEDPVEGLNRVPEHA